MEGYSHLGSMIVIDGRKSIMSFFLIVYIKGFLTTLKECKIGLSLLPVPGFTVRILGNTTQNIENIISHFHQMINQEALTKKRVF